MKHEMTLARFLGIPPLRYIKDSETNFEQLIEGTDATLEISSTLGVNPCSGLPLIENSSIDVAGNAFGTCSDHFEDMHTEFASPLPNVECDVTAPRLLLTHIEDDSSSIQEICLDDSSLDSTSDFESCFSDDSWSNF